MPKDPRTRDELIEAMQQPACGLCVLVDRAERRVIDHFLYDQVNDISRRDALRASRGLCERHTAMLAAGRSALGVAIVSRDILRAMTAELEANGLKRKEGEDRTDQGEKKESAFAPFASFVVKPSRWFAPVGARLAEQIGPQAACPMCAERATIEAPFVAEILSDLDDPLFLAAFDASAGLCRVHLAAVLAAGNAEQARTLAARQAALWRRLEADLDEFIRKHDYRFQGEVFATERDVWLRALTLSSGWYAGDGVTG